MTYHEYINKVIDVYLKHQKFSRVKRIIDWAIKKGVIDAIDVRGSMVPRRMTWTCDKCKYVHYRCDVDGASLRSAMRVVAKAKDEAGHIVDTDFCPHCSDYKTFACQQSGNRYSLDQFTIADVTIRDMDGRERQRRWCVEANMDRLAKHPTTGIWVSTENVLGYHHGVRGWLVPEGEADNFYGVELEILAGMARGSKEAVIRAAVECGLAAERDGSLDSTYGIEVVGPPITYEDILVAKESNPWFKFMQNIQGKCKGWDAGIGYGMHVNMNTQSFGITSKLSGRDRTVVSTTHLSKFVSFICCNEAIGKIVAGRTQTQYANYTKLERIGGANGMLSAIKGYNPDEGRDFAGAIDRLRAARIADGAPRTTERRPRARPRTMMKYLACSIRSQFRVEVRLFRSTIRWDRFVRNMQYCQSVKEYTAQASNLDYYKQANYLEWLGKNQSQFPELASFLFASAVGKEMGCSPSGKVERLNLLSSVDGDTVSDSLKKVMAERKVLVH